MSVDRKKHPIIPDNAPVTMTVSGIHVTPLSLDGSDVRIEDIAHHLGNLCRFTGATREFYSVGQHCVLMSYYVAPHNAMWGLLHDADEYVLNDICRPLKYDAYFGKPVRGAEHRAQSIIAGVFGLELPMPADIKIADKRMLATEARDLLHRHARRDWEILQDKKPYPEKITAWQPRRARREFLLRYDQIKKEAA